jgi:hypothetical protein
MSLNVLESGNVAATNLDENGGESGDLVLVSPLAPVAQLDRASGYEPEGRMFESCRAHHKIP